MNVPNFKFHIEVGNWLEALAREHPDALTRQCLRAYLDERLEALLGDYQDDLREAKLSSWRTATDALLDDLHKAAVSLGNSSLCSYRKILEQYMRLETKRLELEPVEGKVIPFKREGDE